jgi:hypothetical protein
VREENRKKRVRKVEIEWLFILVIEILVIFLIYSKFVSRLPPGGVGSAEHFIFCVLFYVLVELDLSHGNTFYSIVGWLVVCIGRFGF